MKTKFRAHFSDKYIEIVSKLPGQRLYLGDHVFYKGHEIQNCIYIVTEIGPDDNFCTITDGYGVYHYVKTKFLVLVP